MATTVVLVIAVVAVIFVFYWSGRFGDRRRGSGTSLRRGSVKKGFTTREDAVASAQSMSKRGGDQLSAYRCDTCEKWHLGH
jgi:hypothetical protein